MPRFVLRHPDDTTVHASYGYDEKRGGPWCEIPYSGTIVVHDASVEASLGSAGAEERDASDRGADEAERVRLQAEYARLKAAEAAAKREHRTPPSKLGPWEGLGLYAISLALAVLWSWRWRGGRR